MATGREVLEHAFRETARGNGRPFVDMLADDVEWSIIGSTERSGTFRGRSSVIADLLRPLAEQFDGPNTVGGDALYRGRKLGRGGRPKSQRDEARPGLSQPLLLDIRDAERESGSHHRVLRHGPR
jgi:hypothetical protein